MIDLSRKAHPTSWHNVSAARIQCFRGMLTLNVNFSACATSSFTVGGFPGRIVGCDAIFADAARWAGFCEQTPEQIYDCKLSIAIRILCANLVTVRNAVAYG